MSFIYLGKIKQGHCIIDTEDLVTDIFSDKEIRRIKDKGVPVKEFAKTDLRIGIQSYNNSYELYYYGVDRPIYSGCFPSKNKRNDLFAYEIKLVDIGIIGNKLLIAIVCNCWCKYDIELPMTMVQVLSASIKDITSNLCLACFTSEPVYFSTSSIFKRQHHQCFGDFPNKCVSTKDNIVSIDSGKLRVFGVEYTKEMPIYDDLCKKIKFFHV